MHKSEQGEGGLHTGWGEKQVEGSDMCKSSRDHAALGN